jgi:hypothetical protein
MRIELKYNEIWNLDKVRMGFREEGKLKNIELVSGIVSKS